MKDNTVSTNKEKQISKEKLFIFVVLIVFLILVVLSGVILLLVVTSNKESSRGGYSEHLPLHNIIALYYSSHVHITWGIDDTTIVSYVSIKYNNRELGNVNSTTSHFTVSGKEAVSGGEYCVCVITESDTLLGNYTVKAISTGLPTLIISTLESQPVVDKENKIQTNIDIYGNKNQYNFHITHYTATIKGRGNSSWDLPKKGYNINFDQPQTVLGMKAHKKWCIIANYIDKTLLRNSFASWLGHDIFNSIWNPSFVHVDVIMNGDYLGNYIFGETIQIDENRVDIPSIKDIEKKMKTDKTITLDDGGFILEVDSRLDADFYYVSTQKVPFCLKRPDDTKESINTHVENYIQKIEDSLYSSSSIGAENGFLQYINLDSWVDWYIVNEFTKNIDAAFFSSCFMYYNPSDRLLYMGPIWDFDRSCGGVAQLGVEDPTGFHVNNHHHDDQQNWYSKLFPDPLFKGALKNRWNDKRQDVYRLIDSGVQKYADTLKNSANLNFVKWPVLGTDIESTPPGYEQRTTFQSEIDWLIDWLKARYKWFDQAIDEL